MSIFPFGPSLVVAGHSDTSDDDGRFSGQTRSNAAGQWGQNGSGRCRSVTHRVCQDAGDPRFLEVAMKALAEIRDLFKIGAEAESKLRAASPESGLALRALMRAGAIRLTMRWTKPGEDDRSLGGPRLNPFQRFRAV